MSDFKTHTQDQHRQALAAFLPNGRAFGSKNIEGKWLFQVLLALAAEYGRVEEMMDLIASEYDPRTTTLLIEEWEAAVGIPDGCFTNTGTLAERRRNVAIKFGLSIDTRQSFLDLAHALGFDNIIIRTGDYYGMFPLHFPFMFFATAEEALFTIIVELPAALAPGVFGNMIFPFPFGSGISSIIECLFRKLIPIYCDIKFFYIL